MKELLARKFSPTTDTIGFLRCDSDQVVAAFMEWQRVIQSKRGVSLKESKVDGRLGVVIKRLLPLTSVERRRFLFVPTHSNWTAFIDNGHKGGDAFAPISYLAEKLNCEAVRMTFVPEGQKDQYPATILEIFGPHKTDFLNRVRSISAAFDGRKWEFEADGDVQPFEVVEKYSDKLVKNRFTGEMLDNYLACLGISAFDENFFCEEAVLIEKVGPIAPAAREFTPISYVE